MPHTPFVRFVIAVTLTWPVGVGLQWAQAAAPVRAALPANASLPLHLNAVQARHLLVRTGFSPTEAEVNALMGQSAQQAVASIISDAQAARPIYPAPAFVAQAPPIPGRFLKSREEQQATREQQQREALALKAWWMREMIESPAPLKERMTLFWHNHFATSQQKVGSAQAMWRQHRLLRADALGNFSTLLHAVAKDPAMLVYLDGANSRKEAPNENFAREVMELFTLGEATKTGHYTEQDIKEAARAFTGWTVERDDFSFKLRPAFHDSGSKSLLGSSGDFDGDAALDIMLAQGAAARFLVGKLWLEFVSPTPDETQVERIAQLFRQSGYDISSALRELLLTPAFWAENNRGSLIKSPVDLVVGTVRQFNFSYTEVAPFVLKAAQLGQNLLAPPNVKGWPGQKDWINATTLLERKRFTEQLFRAVELKGESKMAPIAMGPGGRLLAVSAASATPPGRDGIMRVAEGMARITFDPEAWLARYGGHADREPSDELKSRLGQVLLALPATHSIATGTVGVAYLRSLTLDPAYQLK